MYLGGAKPDGRDGRVDGGVTRSHNDYSRRHRRQLCGLVTGNEIKRVSYARKILSGNAQPMNSAETDSEKNSIVLAIELSEAGRVDRCSKVKIDSQLRKQFDLAQAFDERKLVFCDAIRI